MKVEIKLLLFTSNDTIVIKKVQVMRIKDFHCNIPVFPVLVIKKVFPLSNTRTCNKSC